MGDREYQPAIVGFGLRVSARRAPFRVFRAEGSHALEYVCEPSELGEASCRIDPASNVSIERAGAGQGRDRHAGLGSGAVSIEAGLPGGQWWIEMPSYRVVLPARSILVASGTPEALPPFELLAPSSASKMSVRTPRRMPSLTSLLAPGQTFRDTGQLSRAAWIEFEGCDAAGRPWTFRHEMLHRGLMAFVFTLQVPDDERQACLPAFVELVESVERVGAASGGASGGA